MLHDFGNVFDPAENVDRKAFLHDDDEAVSGAERLRFLTARCFNASSLPSTRIRHWPDASLNAMPNFICGAVFTIAS